MSGARRRACGRPACWFGAYVCLVMVGLTLPGVAFARQAGALTATPIYTAPTGLPASPVAIGSVVDGIFTIPGGSNRYVFFGAYSDVISIGAFAKDEPALQPILQIVAPDGETLAATQPGSGQAIFNVALPNSGAYIVTVQPGRATTLGAYTLYVVRGPFLRELDGEALGLDKPARGDLGQPGDRQRWTLDIRSGMAFMISAQPAADSKVDPVIEVIAPDGRLLTTAHDFSDANTARTKPINVPVAGTYQVLISAYQNATIGPYLVVATSINTAPATAPSRKTPQPISIASDGHVNAGERFTTLFDGIQGQTVAIRVSAAGNAPFDPVVEVFGPSGRRVAINDDEASNSANAALSMILDDGDGVYTVKISGYALMGGDFSLYIRSP